MYEKIQRWYIQGLWTEDMVRKAAEKGVISEEQAQQILASDGQPE